MNKTTKIIFISSLVLNILLAGLIAGHFFGGKKFKCAFRSGGCREFVSKEERMIKSLPEAKQEKAREVLGQLKEIRRKNFENSKLLFDDVEKIVKSEKFDEAKFLKAFEKFDLAVSSSKKESNKIIAKFLSEITAEERVKLIDEIKKQSHLSRYESNRKRDRDHKKD